MTGAIRSITRCQASLLWRSCLCFSSGGDMDDDIEQPPEKMDALEIVVLVLCAFVFLFFIASIYF
jgi:hypothetical protein